MLHKSFAPAQDGAQRVKGGVLKSEKKTAQLLAHMFNLRGELQRKRGTTYRVGAKEKQGGGFDRMTY